jgi:hypothetical protein
VVVSRITLLGSDSVHLYCWPETDAEHCRRPFLPALAPRDRARAHTEGVRTDAKESDLVEGPEIKFAETVLDNGKYGTRTIRFETGRLAQQAQGAVAAYLD